MLRRAFLRSFFAIPLAIKALAVEASYDGLWDTSPILDARFRSVFNKVYNEAPSLLADVYRGIE